MSGEIQMKMMNEIEERRFERYHIWFKKGTNIKHNPCGPAMIYYADGGVIEREWWLNGLMHREDGPAFEGRSHELWYIHGKCHRLDGPADINFSVNRTLWYINGYPCDEEIRKWAKERDIDLNNLSDLDKAVIALEWSNYNG
jgi:hypothetical protein